MHGPEGLQESPVPVAPILPALSAPQLSDTKSERQRNGLRPGNLFQIAVPKQERLFLGGCLLFFWLINAASLSGYVILAVFLLVALARFVRHVATAFIASLPKRSQLRHYLVLSTSLAFFSLLVVRACYIATVIVDAEFRSDPFIDHSRLIEH